MVLFYRLSFVRFYILFVIQVYEVQVSVNNKFNLPKCKILLLKENAIKKKKNDFK